MIEHLLGHSLTKGVLSWVASGRRGDAASRTADDAGWELRFGRRFRLLWTVGSLITLGFLALGAWAGITEDIELPILLSFLAMSLGLHTYCLLWGLRAYMYRLRLYPWGIEIALPGWQVIKLAWADVTKVEYSKVFDAAVLKRSDGRPPVRVLLELDGVQRLQESLEAKFGMLDYDLAARLTGPQSGVW